MSAPSALVDPQQSAFWASDPSILVDPNQIAPPGPAPLAAHRARLALEIAAAFVVCARLVRLALAARHAVNNPREAAQQAWDSVVPVFSSLTATALVDALRLDPATSTLSLFELSQVAKQYTEGLADYLGATSIAAFLRGLDRQQTMRWSETVAWVRAAAGFGLDDRAFGPFLAKSASMVDTVLVAPAAQAIADASLLARAQLVGESEAQTAGESAKALHWIQGQAEGLFSPNALRKWVTAVREDKCKICGPLDGTTAPLDKPFVVAGHELWSPQAHPNCRCHLELIEPVEKASWDSRKHPRGQPANGGEFRRKPKPAYKPVAERVRGVADDIWEQVEAEKDKTAEVINPFLRPVAPNAFLGSNPFQNGPAATNAFVRATSPFTRAAQAVRSGAFAATGAFRRTPKLRVQQPRILVPPPTLPIFGDPYYMPVDRYFAEVNEHDVGTLLGMNADVDFDAAHPTTYGALFAEAQPSPWDVLSYDDRARGRIDLKSIHTMDGTHVTPRVAETEVHTLWDVMLPDLQRGWTEAIANAQYTAETHRGIVGELYPQDRANIAEMAGFTDYTDDVDLIGKIIESTQDLGSGNDSLANAYADYVVYNRPDKLGELGNELKSHFIVAEGEGIHFDNRPADQVLVFQQGFHPGTRVSTDDADPRGKYIATKLVYHSALHEMPNPPPLAMGLQEAYMQPFVENPKPFLGPHGWEPPLR